VIQDLRKSPNYQRVAFSARSGSPISSARGRGCSMRADSLLTLRLAYQRAEDLRALDTPAPIELSTRRSWKRPFPSCSPDFAKGMMMIPP
jgi:hypothetical protein